MKYQSPYLGLKSKDIVCLATNENPYPLPEIVVDKLKQYLLQANRYPKVSNEKLISLISKHIKTNPENILVSAGSDELLMLIALSYITKGSNSIMFNPSFFRYKQVTELAQGICKLINCTNFQCNLDDIYNAVDENTRVIFLCNPNNPTGELISSKKIHSFIQNIPKEVLIVIDEAYFDFVNPIDEIKSSIEIIDSASNLIVIRTFSKLFGLAGLRIGYAVANSNIISHIEKIKSPYSVNAIAQEAVISILENEMLFYKDYPNEVIREKNFLYQNFEVLKIEYIPSQANFIFVKLGERCNAIIDKLREENFIIRPCEMFGFPEYARITVGKETENRKLVELLKKVIQ